MDENQYKKALIDMISNIHSVDNLKRIYKLVKYLYLKKADG